jgi:RES domain-containing protein
MYDRNLLQALARIEPIRWGGIVFRHMFANYPPQRENTLGARWNPPQVPAIYTSLSRDGVLAEAQYQIDSEPRRPRVRRTVYRISVRLASVLDLTPQGALASVGLAQRHLIQNDQGPCQAVGGAAEYLEHDGLIVPSARLPGAVNLIIYPNRQAADYLFDVEEQDVIYDPSKEG